MITFDQIDEIVSGVFQEHVASLPALGAVVINRDLNGRVRLVVRAAARDDGKLRPLLDALRETLATALGPHAYSPDRMILFEEDPLSVIDGLPRARLGGVEAEVYVVDRLATEGDWATIEQPSSGPPRVVFFSIKGGVGRSTALAVAAWTLAESGKRVLVVDLDLESPGLSSSLLPEARRPRYGVTDWLVEDLVDNGDAVLDGMRAVSLLSREGEIHVVPAHGLHPGEYVAKLGRAWMPKITSDGGRQIWSKRLARLLDGLEQQVRPDIVLLDSRAGIDEVASACVTDLGAQLVLLFALNGEQTWTGYDILLGHWNRMDVIRDIRERIQLVGAMVPELGGREYIEGLRDRAATLFADHVYDAVPPGDVGDSLFNFDEADSAAPHAPVAITWNRGFAALESVHSKLAVPDAALVQAVYGPLVDLVSVVTRTPGLS